ncbi:unnamed protein product [Vitrella brassicaformis CCMP3155]|uniref:Uncharacterized protein n=1 Tax=Vitrella brassicaformis (strain CCMP3155) TaxID=1169540 RepID=A0A0G4ENW9_VITBC|nr:unnamed protein product [Vitrella brassicaformis CCMP3155]|eukprot:CEL99318.1 unnamed protein product [Vitrella brassicaformis CCMP3155]
MWPLVLLLIHWLHGDRLLIHGRPPFLQCHAHALGRHGQRADYTSTFLSFFRPLKKATRRRRVRSPGGTASEEMSNSAAPKDRKTAAVQKLYEDLLHELQLIQQRNETNQPTEAPRASQPPTGTGSKDEANPATVTPAEANKEHESAQEVPPDLVWRRYANDKAAAWSAAVTALDIKAMEELLRLGLPSKEVDPNQPFSSAPPVLPLSFAILRNDLDAVRLLHEGGADPNAPSPYCGVASEKDERLVVSRGPIDTLFLTFTHGTAVEGHGMSALNYEFFYKAWDILTDRQHEGNVKPSRFGVQRLFINSNIEDPCFKRPRLFDIIFRSPKDGTINLLQPLEEGPETINWTKTDAAGNTVLHIAAAGGTAALIRHLLKRPEFKKRIDAASFMQRDEEKWSSSVGSSSRTSPFESAAEEYGYIAARIEYDEEYMDRLHLSEEDACGGLYPLHCLTMQHFQHRGDLTKRVAELLVENYAGKNAYEMKTRVNSVDNTGRTPLHVLVADYPRDPKKGLNTIRHLLNRGADPSLGIKKRRAMSEYEGTVLDDLPGIGVPRKFGDASERLMTLKSMQMEQQKQHIRSFTQMKTTEELTASSHSLGGGSVMDPCSPTPAHEIPGVYYVIDHLKVRPCQEGWTAVHLACWHGSSNVISLLMDGAYKADPNARTAEYSRTPLHIFLANEDTASVNLRTTVFQLTERGADINAVDGNGFTPIFYFLASLTSYHDQPWILNIKRRKQLQHDTQLLIKLTARTDVQAHDGSTPAMHAYLTFIPQVIKEVVAHYPNMTLVQCHSCESVRARSVFWRGIIGFANESTILHMFSIEPRLQAFYSFDGAGQTPLFRAARSLSPHAVAKLLEYVPRDHPQSLVGYIPPPDKAPGQELIKYLSFLWKMLPFHVPNLPSSAFIDSLGSPQWSYFSLLLPVALREYDKGMDSAVLSDEDREALGRRLTTVFRRLFEEAAIPDLDTFRRVQHMGHVRTYAQLARYVSLFDKGQGGEPDDPQAANWPLEWQAGLDVTNKSLIEEHENGTKFWRWGEHRLPVEPWSWTLSFVEMELAPREEVEADPAICSDINNANRARKVYCSIGKAFEAIEADRNQRAALFLRPPVQESAQEAHYELCSDMKVNVSELLQDLGETPMPFTESQLEYVYVHIRPSPHDTTADKQAHPWRAILTCEAVSYEKETARMMELFEHLRKLAKVDPTSLTSCGGELSAKRDHNVGCLDTSYNFHFSALQFFGSYLILTDVTIRGAPWFGLYMRDGHVIARHVRFESNGRALQHYHEGKRKDLSLKPPLLGSSAHRHEDETGDEEQEGMSEMSNLFKLRFKARKGSAVMIRANLFSLGQGRKHDSGHRHIFDNSVFEDNLGENGAAIQVTYDPFCHSRDTTTSIRECVFRNNTANTGGAIYERHWGGSGGPSTNVLHIESSTFGQNLAQEEGGAVF